MKRLCSMIRHAYFSLPPWFLLRSRLVNVRDLSALKDAMGWRNDPVISDGYWRECVTEEDVNNRRLRDAEVLGAVCCNESPRNLVEIGTGEGHGTVLMAENAPDGIVTTINPAPGTNTGGRFTTYESSDFFTVGACYRERGMMNVRQVLMDSRLWMPSSTPIDVAFIDGCHDFQYVRGDTRRILSACREGSIIMWHDFAPDMVLRHAWVAEVCRAVETMFATRILHGPVFHVRDSWIGLYRVISADLC